VNVASTTSEKAFASSNFSAKVSVERDATSPERLVDADAGLALLDDEMLATGCGGHLAF